VDKSVITRVVRVAGGRFAPGHLGELTQQVPFEMVDAVLGQTCRVQRRVRDLPARVVVYLLLAGCLFAELGYAQVWHRLAAGLDGLPVAAPTASAMTQARRRLGPGPRRELFFLLRGPSPAAAGWRGLLVCAIDGTIMSAADSAANLAVYSKQRGGRVLRARTPDGIEQEIYALLITYQVLRTAIADAAATAPGTDPDRASFAIALNASRDQVILAAGVTVGPVIDLAGAIGRLVLASLMPARRLRVSPRVVKRAMSRYNARGKVDRTTYKATIDIAILATP
jgi:hypothetical protein